MLWPVCFSFGQDHSHTAKDSNIYEKALFASVAEMEKEWGRQVDAPDYHHMLVKADPSLTAHLPSDSGSYHVEYLDDRAQIAQFRQLQKKYPILEIHPALSDGPQLKIIVSLSYFSHKRGRSMFEVSDWSDVQFRFDCQKQEFVVSDVKLGGI